MNKNIFSKLAASVVALSLPFVLATANENLLIPSEMIGTSQFTDPAKLRGRFEINIDALNVKKIANRRDRYTSIMEGSYDAEILMRPLVKPLMSIDTIYAHPSFISTIIFPANYEIIDAKTNIQTLDFTRNQNIITLSPAPASTMGNIVITAFDHTTKRNSLFSILVKKYARKSLQFDNEFGLYATNEGEFLSLMNVYHDIQKIDELKLLERYVRLNGEAVFEEVFGRDGNVESLIVDGVPVFIERNEQMGNIRFFNKRFRISVGGRA